MRDQVAAYALLHAIGLQHAEGAIGIVLVARFHDSHMHRRAMRMRDFLQAGRTVEGSSVSFLNAESRTRSIVENVSDGAEVVRSVGCFEATLQPQTTIRPADTWPRGVNPAAAFWLLMSARIARALADLIDTQNLATQ